MSLHLQFEAGRSRFAATAPILAPLAQAQAAGEGVA